MSARLGRFHSDVKRRRWKRATGEEQHLGPLRLPMTPSEKKKPERVTTYFFPSVYIQETNDSE